MRNREIRMLFLLENIACLTLQIVIFTVEQELLDKSVFFVVLYAKVSECICS